MQQYGSFQDYRSARGLSIFAIVGLALSAASSLVSILIGLGQVLSPGSPVDLGDGQATSLWLMLQGLIYLMLVPVSIATVVGFLMWLYRAHSNLPALGPTSLQFSPGWAVGWWFIPFANLVKPFQVVREVWWESDPDVPEGPSFLSASLHSAPTYMGFWWAFWLISNILNNITSNIYNPESMDNVGLTGWLFVVTGIATIIAAVLAIRVVRDITARQELRRAVIGNRTMNDPPPPPTFGRDRPNDPVYGGPPAM